MDLCIEALRIGWPFIIEGLTVDESLELGIVANKAWLVEE